MQNASGLIGLTCVDSRLLNQATCRAAAHIQRKQTNLCAGADGKMTSRAQPNKVISAVPRRLKPPQLDNCGPLTPTALDD